MANMVYDLSSMSKEDVIALADKYVADNKGKVYPIAEKLKDGCFNLHGYTDDELLEEKNIDFLLFDCGITKSKNLINFLNNRISADEYINRNALGEYIFRLHSIMLELYEHIKTTTDELEQISKVFKLKPEELKVLAKELK